MPEETNRLRMALLHLAPRFGEVKANRSALFEAVRASALRGARLVVAPELAVSGYSFESREEAAAFAEPVNGPTLQSLGELCRDLSVYCAVGLLERDTTTNLLHNSAFLVGPSGALLGRHRKLVAERRWATPGNPLSPCIVETPWGRLGMLVCADSYFALPARALALRGADLILTLANWPPSGVDPRRIWRARALENGVGIVACNRGGVDRRLDCSEARSFAVGPSGEVLLDAAAKDGTTLWLDWPLSHSQFVQNRATALTERTPEQWTSLGLDVNGLDDTTYLWGHLPQVPVSLTLLTNQCELAFPPDGQSLHVYGLPEGDNSAKALRQLQEQTVPSGVVLIGSDEVSGPFLATSETTVRLDGRSYLLHCAAGLRIALSRPEVLRHPEVAVALAKEGCDVLVLPSKRVDENLAAMIATRCLERLPVALVMPRRATLFLPPDGHGPWKELQDQGDEPLQVRLDIGGSRRRHLFNRIDLDTLLCNPSAT